MDLDKIKVNETHICVLRKKDNEDELFVDFIELKLRNNNQLLELKDMSENENRSVLELIDYVENSTLNDLTKSFNFCESFILVLGCRKSVIANIINYWKNMSLK